MKKPDAKEPIGFTLIAVALIAFAGQGFVSAYAGIRHFIFRWRQPKTPSDP